MFEDPIVELCRKYDETASRVNAYHYLTSQACFDEFGWAEDALKERVRLFQKLVIEKDGIGRQSECGQAFVVLTYFNTWFAMRGGKWGPV